MMSRRRELKIGVIMSQTKAGPEAFNLAKIRDSPTIDAYTGQILLSIGQREIRALLLYPAFTSCKARSTPETC